MNHHHLSAEDFQELLHWQYLDGGDRQPVYWLERELVQNVDVGIWVLLCIESKILYHRN